MTPADAAAAAVSRAQKCATNGHAAAETLNNEAAPRCSSPTSVGSPNMLQRKVANAVVAPEKKKMMSHLAKRPPVEIEFRDVCYTVAEGGGFFVPPGKRQTKNILKSVSGKFKSGELTAIMGPSGAGKSTLMNILAGYKTSNVTGEITINGKTRNLRKFRKMSCYIMQDDCLPPHLTVAESMAVAANLKLGEKLSADAKRQVISEIVDHLGLTDCMDVRTSRISGGQRKRLAIALELVNNPPVMFFDEPTSGLDSASCSQCISLLKQLAREGRTIICTIHQPSARIFEMFDKLVMLGEGNNIYKGTVKGLVPFLSSMGLTCPSYHNPADYVMEVASGEYGNYTEKLVNAVSSGKCNNLSEGSPSVPAKVANNNAVNNSSSPLHAGKREDNHSHVTISESTIRVQIDDDSGEAQLSHDHVKVDIPEAAAALCKSRCPDVATNGTLVPLTTSSLSASVPVECRNSLLGGSAESIDDACGAFPTSTWTQFRILFVRTFLSIVRDETLTKLRIISHVAIGLLLGVLYWDMGNEASKVFNNSAMLFFCMLFSMFTAMMPTVMTFPLEMNTFRREHLNYWYSVKSYYLAKVMADMPFQIVYPSVFVIIVYFMTSQPLEIDRLGMFLLMCILTSLVAQSLGLVIGCAVDVQSAVYLGPITTIPILLFSGFFVSLENIPTFMQWLTYIAYVRYGFEGAILAIYGYDRETLHCSVPYCHFKYPKKFLEEMAMDKGVFWIDVVSLIVFFVGLRVIGYFVLRYKIRSEK